MWKLKNYKFGVNLSAVFIFAFIMIPSTMWMLYPAPHDVLRLQEAVPVLESLQNALRFLMVPSLIFIVNREYHPPVDTKSMVGICFSYLMYGACWGFYYLGFSGPIVILILCIAPSLCFVLEGWARKNGPGFVLSLVFLILHTLWGVLKFL